MIKRRDVLYGFGVAASTIVLRTNAFAAQDQEWSDKLVRNLKEIEKERGGRLGVAVTDSSSGKSAAHRGDERFPMCSTFKVLAAAAVLAKVDAGKEQLDHNIRFEARDVVENSPVTKARAGSGGMSLAEICEAAITMSDNTAGNLLLANIGGPTGLTAYAKSLGDNVTRLDRIEPELNEALPDDPRDTTSPVAMMSNYRALVTGNKLSKASTDRLVGWLIGNKTGDTRLRAGFPHGWRIGDKTGAGERGTTNDVAVAWPSSDKPPLFVSVYLTGSSTDSNHRNATLASVGKIIGAAF